MSGGEYMFDLEAEMTFSSNTYFLGKCFCDKYVLQYSNDVGTDKIG